ncbi:MAG: hypothetical protein QXF61_11450 [Nitrososphaeria archaeon]
MMRCGKVRENLSKILTIFKFILALITALNIFIQFMPRHISIAISLFLACAFHFENFPEIVSEFYGDFANKGWVKMFMTSYAATGYLIPYLIESLSYFFIANLLFYIFFVGALLAWPIGILYRSAGKIPIFRRKFWRKLCQGFGADTVEEWRKVERFPIPSLARKVEEFLWQYTPGLVLTNFFGLISLFIWLALSMLSPLFAILLILWLLAFLYNNPKGQPRIIYDKNRPIDIIKENLLSILKVAIRSEKSLFSSISILIGILLSCVPIYIWLPLLINYLQNLHLYTTLTFILFQLLFLAFLVSHVLLIVYQFIFWYVMIERLPSFIIYWNNQSRKYCAKPIPAGGLVVFGLSWIFTVLLDSIHMRLYENSHGLGFIKATRSPLLWAFLIVIISLMTSAIIFSMKSRSKISKDLHKDAFIIPLATFISLISVSLELARFSTFQAIFVAYFSMLIIWLFYVPDLRRFLSKQFGIFERRETFNIFLYTILPISTLPMLFLLPEIGIALFTCTLLLSLLALSVTAREIIKSKDL